MQTVYTSEENSVKFRLHINLIKFVCVYVSIVIQSRVVDCEWLVER